MADRRAEQAERDREAATGLMADIAILFLICFGAMLGIAIWYLKGTRRVDGGEYHTVLGRWRRRWF